MTSSPSVWLKVCVTCDRSARLEPDQLGHGAKLADRIGGTLHDQGVSSKITVRRVPCLSGCKHPGNIAVGAMGRASIRLHNLGLERAGAVVELAMRFMAHSEGALNDDVIPHELNGHLAAIILPH
jgi:predicted metal-binding protein